MRDESPIDRLYDASIDDKLYLESKALAGGIPFAGHGGGVGAVSFGKNVSGIYAIVNLINDKKYVGSAKEVNGRIKEHLCNLKKGTHDNCHLQKAWNKYGSNNFGLQLIEIAEECNLLVREQIYLDLPNLYNIAKVAGKPPSHPGNTFATVLRGRKQSLEHVAKRMETREENYKQNGWPSPSEETKKKIGDYWRGKPKSVEHNKKNSEGQRGIKRGPHTEEHKRKLSKSQIGKPKSPEHRLAAIEGRRLAMERRKIQ